MKCPLFWGLDLPAAGGEERDEEDRDPADDRYPRLIVDRLIGDVHVADPAREHHREDDQDQNASDVDQDLGDGDEIARKKHKKPRRPGEGSEERKGGVEDSPREGDPHCGDQCETGDDEKG